MEKSNELENSFDEEENKAKYQDVSRKQFWKFIF